LLSPSKLLPDNKYLFKAIKKEGVMTNETTISEEIRSTPSGHKTDLTTPSGHKTDYVLTRRVCTVVAFIGWLVVGIGCIVASFAIINVGGFGMNATPLVITGFAAALSGFFTIMGSQVTRATVDNADHTREILFAISQQRDR
jgi:hypothetical protein